MKRPPAVGPATVFRDSPTSMMAASAIKITGPAASASPPSGFPRCTSQRSSTNPEGTAWATTNQRLHGTPLASIAKGGAHV